MTAPRVLVVDDDDGCRSLTRFALERAGWTVTEAGTAAAGLAVMGPADPDVVLLDLVLPDADGFSVLAALKEAEATSWVPVVVMSGCSEPAEVERLLLAGAQDFLFKPVSDRAIHARLVAARRVAIEHRRLKAAEDSLRRLAAVVENSHDAILVLDAAGNVLTWNDAAERVYGYSAEEMIGRSPIFMARPGGEAERDRAHEGLRRGISSTTEVALSRKDGTPIVVSVARSPIMGHDGELVAVSSICRDVTANSRAEAALAESEERYRLLADQLNAAQAMAHIGSWTRDITGAAIVWSDELYRIFGLEPGGPAPSADQLLTMIHPDDQARVEATIRHSVQAGTGFASEHRIVRPDGSSRVVHFQGQPVLGGGDIVAGMAGTAQDVTESREAATALAASEELFRSLFASAPEGVFQTDVSGCCTFTNGRWDVLTGLKSGAALGVGWMIAIGPDDRDARFATWQHATRLGQDWTERLEIYTSGNTKRWVRCRTAALRDESGQVTGFVGTVADVTDVVESETVVSDARDQAIEATRAKSQFLANMSHEIRTPMNGVLGMADILLGTELDDTQRKCLNTLRQSGQHLLLVINDILDFSKIEAGKLDLEDGDFDLLALVEDVAGILAPSAHDKNLSLTSVVDNDVPAWVRGDSMRLRQVLTNLVGNAIKFTESGSVNLAVTGGRGRRVSFMVTDTGIGIDSEQRETILEPFTQADVTTTRRFGGTGLGLTICHQLVGLMGGALSLISILGGGTTVSFDLCLREGSRPRAHGWDDVAPGPSDVAHRAREGRALVVDDNEVNRMVARHMLERLGYLVDVAGDGAQAVKIFRRGEVSYDVVLMDSLMPNMDGLEATAAIRGIEAGGQQHTPIIAQTASAMLGDREKCLAAGMDDYVSKPISANALGAAVARCQPQRPQ